MSSWEFFYFCPKNEKKIFYVHMNVDIKLSFYNSLAYFLDDVWYCELPRGKVFCR